MESIQPEPPTRACSSLEMPSLQNQMSSSQTRLLPDLCFSSSVCKIADESVLYLSGILDDTVNPSFISNGPGANVALPDELKTKKTDVISESAKVAYNNWLSIPVEHGHSVDISTSITSAQNGSEDTTDVTETNPKGDGTHDPDSTSSTEKCDLRGDSNGSTSDMAKDLKEPSLEVDCTKSLICERTESNNVTFEKSTELQEKSSGLSSTVTSDDASNQIKHEHHLNSTVDICAPANVTTDQPAGKHDCTVDISQSKDAKQEQSSETLSSSKDCDKHGTFIKSIDETSTGVQLVADVEKNVRPSSIPAGVDQSNSLNVEKVDRTFTKHNTTTDLTSGPNPNMTKDTTNIAETPNEEILVQPSTNGDAAETPVSEQPALLSTAAATTIEVSVCSNRPLDLPLIESKGDEQQHVFTRKNGVSDGESYLNLDISHSSMFSLDDMLDMKPCPLVASTPIVLGRGFDRLGLANPTDVQKRLSVINSIDSQLNDDSVSITKHGNSDASKTNPPLIKSEASNQIQKVSAKNTSNSSTSLSAVPNNPPSKLAVRRKIPQPSIKSGIPKTQIPPRPSASHTTAAVKSKNQTAGLAVNQPETASSTLHNLRRTAQLNKGKSFAPTKNAMSIVKTSSWAASNGGFNLPADVKAPDTFLTKASGLQPPGRGRFVVKPPNNASVLKEIGQPHTSGIRTRSSLLPGFSQKHASSDALPLAKRKKTDAHNLPTCPEASAKPSGGAQKHVTVPTSVRPKKPSGDCESCTLLQEKLQAFHQELGEYLERIPADCETWRSFQQTFETCLKEFKRIQAAHQ